MTNVHPSGRDPRVAVLGSGMAACGAANWLHAAGVQPVMYDQNTYAGGHTASFRHPGGFIFDIGPHISYTKVPRIQELYAELVDQQYEPIQIRLNNYWRGHWPTHPVQLHLHGLPEDVVVKAIADFIEEHHAPERPIKNYADWLLASFGRTFAELFPMQYTRKYHLTPAENLTIDWLGPRIYRPNIEEVLRGALSADAPNIHPYISHFRYPTHGGVASHVSKLVQKGDLRLEHRLVALDPRKKELTFASGQRAEYDAVVSSIPLPELIPIMAGAPQCVLDAAARLGCSSCRLVNLGGDRPDISAHPCTHFYDDEFSLTPLSFSPMLSA